MHCHIRPTSATSADIIFGNAIAVDQYGNAYIAGTTDHPKGPVAKKAAVVELNSTGSATDYVTTLGGNSPYSTTGLGIAVDANDNAYVTGATNDSSFLSDWWGLSRARSGRNQ